MTEADRVWNRACYRGGVELREGDRALGAMLLVHGYIANGGVGHAFDLPTADLEEGLVGYQFFGLSKLAATIKPHSGEDEEAYNNRYYELEDRQASIRAAFDEMFRTHPERFAPIAR